MKPVYDLLDILPIEIAGRIFSLLDPDTLQLWFDDPLAGHFAVNNYHSYVSVVSMLRANDHHFIIAPEEVLNGPRANNFKFHQSRDPFCSHPYEKKVIYQVPFESSAIDFATFRATYPTYSPTYLGFQDANDLLWLHNRHPQLLSDARHIEVMIDDSVADKDAVLSRVLQLPYNISLVTVFASGAYCHRMPFRLLLERLTLRGGIIADKRDLFRDKVPQLLCLRLSKVFISLDDLRLLPATLKLLYLKSLLTITLADVDIDSPVLKIDLPRGLQHLKVKDVFAPGLVRSSLDSLGVVTFDLSHLTRLSDIRLFKFPSASLSQLLLPLSTKILHLEECPLQDLDTLELYSQLQSLVLKRNYYVSVHPDFYTKTRFPPNLETLELIWFGIYDSWLQEGVRMNATSGSSTAFFSEILVPSKLVLDERFVLPPSLQKLEVSDIPNLHMDTSRVVLPSGLKDLVLKSFAPSGDLLRLELPSGLQKLELVNLGISTIDHMTFPTSLREVSFRENRLASITNASFPRLKHLNRLDLSKNAFLTSKSFHESLPERIQTLVLEDSDLVYLGDLPCQDLVELKFKRTGRDLGSCTELDLPRGLRHLNLWHKKVNWRSVDFGFPKRLTTLTVETRCHDFPTLVRLLPQSLRKLCVTIRKELVLDAFLPLKSAFPLQLEEICITGLAQHPILDCVSLSGCKNLKEVFLTSAVNHLNFDVLPASLERIDVADGIDRPSCGSLARLSRLTVLNISKCDTQRLFMDPQSPLPASLQVLVLRRNEYVDLHPLNIDRCVDLRIVDLHGSGINFRDICAFVKRLKRASDRFLYVVLVEAISRRHLDADVLQLVSEELIVSSYIRKRKL